MIVSQSQKEALKLVDQILDDMSSWCSSIFELGETAWREYRSAEWYVNKLRKEGFNVEEGSAGMPTAFCAEWSNGSGPVIGMYAEYDAVPGNCQAATTTRQPRSGLSYHAGGHTDPHSGLGISSLGGLLVTKSIMEKYGIKGGLRYTGEPAEKVRGSKPIHAAKGYYDGLAAMLSFHPFYMLPLCNTVRLETHCGAAYSMIYRFTCEQPELWGVNDNAPIAQSHSKVRAPGANEALMLMYSTSKALRDSMLPHKGGWSISEAIISSGQATADNLPAGLSEIQYMIRVPTTDMGKNVVSVLDANAKSVAQMTGCEVTKHWVCKSRPGLPNHVMTNLVWDAIKLVGPPRWDNSAKDIAREIQKNLGLRPMRNPFINELSELISPTAAEEILRQDLSPNQLHSTSDDYTDMCWHTPTARFYIARPALKGGPHPNWVMNALGGIAETIKPMLQTTAKVLTVSALRVLEDKVARGAAMEEFKNRISQNFIPPLCDYEPPINFKWPEYVTTDRGRDWHIPSKFTS